MENNAEPIIKEIRQIGIVVKDIDEAVKRWSELGVGPWTSITIVEDENNDTTLYGEKCSFVVKLANAWVGSLEIELMQPISGKSPHSDFLEQHGEGVHHLAMFLEDPRNTAKQVQEKGYEEMMNTSGFGPLKDGVAVFVDTMPGLTVALELVKPPTIPDDCKLDQ